MARKGQQKVKESTAEMRKGRSNTATQELKGVTVGAEKKHSGDLERRDASECWLECDEQNVEAEQQQAKSVERSDRRNSGWNMTSKASRQNSRLGRNRRMGQGRECVVERRSRYPQNQGG